MADGHYRIDLDRLSAMIEDCEAFDKKVEEWVGQIDAAIARLHASWSGQAAEQQRAYHDRWAKGLAQMREGLQELRGQAKGNHQAYTGVIAHQKGMWP
ncbi:WXG100 family type VII secretion target [Segniliparus rugosus]|uniref:ESAT-6-like protein n=1 Tax=Segniliparus rugosus (strain ATCC BAA-974 / DSM 45345 / CCUG 50838 / CIP 108380 / JCM 13579 / CDC 945) TaxID=679197 RepID=E5XNS5_SEGRC|nr:WXG100 family type VII secretion target [Segniliparus rugosus]EFV13995.1 WXG100 family type VII secretion target [Segniliparus rugosus ATCC BAA-974]